MTAPPLTGARLLHTMLRVRDLNSALQFYVGQLGMQLLRLQPFPEGRFTLAFVGYGPEAQTAVLELTHNWDEPVYTQGNAFGHVAIAVPDVHQATAALAQAGVPVIRAAGPLKGDPGQVIAFVEDPDGYRVELIQTTAAHLQSPRAGYSPAASMRREA